MQYAEIIVDTKTSLTRQTFTYSIKPEQLPFIKPGVVVDVPFHGRNMNGIVLTLKNRVDSKIRLKSINEIIDTFPIINTEYLEIAQKISDYYLAPINEIVFMMIPPIAKRQTSKEIIDSLSKENNRNKSEGKYLIYDRSENRINHYLKLIDKAIRSNKNCLILFPKIDNTRLLIDKIKDNYALLHSQLNTSEKYKIWKEIVSNKTKIVIGSRSAIFAPLRNLGLIIIDSPEDFGYKDDQSPRYHALKVAEIISQTRNVNLVLGADCMNVDEYYKIQNNRYKILKNNFNIVKKQVIDISTDKKIISTQAENLIQKYLDDDDKILIFINRKGEGTYFKCLDCGNISTCSKCNNPLINSNDKLVCFKCNRNEIIPGFCKICNGSNLKNFGIGTGTVQKETKSLFPSAKTIIVENNLLPNTYNLISEANLVVATSKIFEQINFKPDLSVILNFDNVINLPEYYSLENAYILLQKISALTNKEIVIQTHDIENTLFKNINNNYSLLKYISNERKLYKYPPFGSIIKILYENIYEDKCISKLQNLEKNLKTIFDVPNEIQITNTHQCFIGKKRNKFRYQIIIKSPVNNIRIKEKLSKIKGLTNFSIDVDPITLL